MKYTIAITVHILLCSTCLVAQQDAKVIAQKVADAYGYKHYHKVNTLTYTFNVKRDTFAVNSRSWVWNKKDNIVTLTSPKQNITYKRDTIQSSYVKGIDAKFINDQYWLLFPFHVIMDAGTTLSIAASVIAPITKARTSKLTVQYNNVDGYTPGDAYDVYITDDYKILEWAYRAKGTATVSLATTWNKNVKNKKITTPTDFKNETGNFNIYFTGVSIQ